MNRRGGGSHRDDELIERMVVWHDGAKSRGGGSETISNFVLSPVRFDRRRRDERTVFRSSHIVAKHVL